jgi:recombinational DNA repair protein RecT
MARDMAKAPQQNAVAFRKTASNSAVALLSDWVGPERAKEAAGRISLALAAAAQSARDPSEFYQCTPQSVAQCVANAALANIFPGTGSSALAYVIPQRARQGEPPQLTFMVNHRGLNALARRSGQTMVAIPVGGDDDISFSRDGEIVVENIDFDDPPVNLAELRGVIILVKDINTGNTIVRGWVPKKIIEKRKNQSRSKDSQYGPWKNWPVEMAMKTAMHYAISRGWCVIDDADAVRAIALEDEIRGPIDLGKAHTAPSPDDAMAALEAPEAQQFMLEDGTVYGELEPGTWSDANGEIFDKAKHKWDNKKNMPMFSAGLFERVAK